MSSSVILFGALAVLVAAVLYRLVRAAIAARRRRPRVRVTVTDLYGRTLAVGRTSAGSSSSSGKRVA